MANPRQRRKARSSSYNPVSHSRRAQRNLKKMPPIRGPKVLQEAWDKHKTIKQNYAKLGLTHTLAPFLSGGVEASASRDYPQDADTSYGRPEPSIPRGYGKIIRDESGNVERIELSPEEESVEKDGLMVSPPEISQPITDRWITGLGKNPKVSAESRAATDVVTALEQISTPIDGNSRTLSLQISGSGARTWSGGERRYLERLVGKYGGDVDGMVKDRKLNPEQRTAGQLRRGLRKAVVAMTAPCGVASRSMSTVGESSRMEIGTG